MKLYESQKKYYQENKKQILEKAKKYNQKPEVKARKKEVKRKWHQKNRDKRLKQMKEYRQTKEYKEANKKRTGKNYKENKGNCKDKALKRLKENYQNPEKKRIILKMSHTHKQKLKDLKQNFRKNKNCVSCGWNKHLEILHFHHPKKENKEGDVSHISSLTKLKKEMEKCILLCPNCHYWLHYQEQSKDPENWTKKKNVNKDLNNY